MRGMTAEEYDAWFAAAVESYAAETADAGTVASDDARRRAAEQTRGFLPDGLATPRMHLLRVLDDDGEAVGVLWIGPHPRRADAGWVYDVEIAEDRRGEGLGRAAMLAAEQVCIDEGWTSIGLNVFGPNTRARALYDSLGYGVTNTNMLKPLG